MHIDNAFARTVLADIQPSKRRPRPSSSLCTDCQEFDFFNSLGFAVEYTAEDLKSRAYDECDLCTLFWKTAERYGMADRGVKIGFKKAQSWLRMDGVGSPVLTICGSLGNITPQPFSPFVHHINGIAANDAEQTQYPVPTSN